MDPLGHAEPQEDLGNDSQRGRSPGVQSTDSRDETLTGGRDAWRLAKGIVGIFVTALLTLLVNSVLGDPVNSLFHGEPEGLDGQLGAIEHEASTNGAYGQYYEADLRGPGLRSIFIVSSHTGDLAKTGAARSDRLEIWDLVGTGADARFVKRWTFTPRAVVAGYDSVPWDFHLEGIADVGHDGEQEIIGSLQTQTAAHPPRVPVMVRWDPGQERYCVIPLIDTRPRLRRGQLASWADTYQLLDSQPVTIGDAQSATRISGYSAQYFGVAATESGPVVVVAYPAAVFGQASPLRYQLIGFAIDLGHLRAGETQFDSCTKPGPVFERAGFGGLASSAVVASWRRLSGCG